MDKETKQALLFNTAILWGSASYCKRNKVGAVLEKDGRILATGFNGSLSGFPNECEDNDVTMDNIVHAEQNIICFAAKNGISTKDTSLYVTISPCVMCAKLIIQSGIKEVYYLVEYRNSEGIELLKKANVHCEKIDILKLLK